jgi:Predicted branched-chain amino acid permease (azaleucine resistance)
MIKKEPLTFQLGIKHGIPIALGYLSVSFAFGMIAADKGFSAWAPILTSISSFTGTGQFVGINLISLGASFVELVFTLLIINARYVLMSVSLSQRLSAKVTLWQRCLIAFGNTDEVFAVAMNNGQLLDFRYMSGLILVSYSGWILGTILGAFSGGLLPGSIASAFGIMLYAMFVAIIIPPAKEKHSILFVIFVASAISCAFRYVPALKPISGGWVVIIGGVLSAVIGALIFPMERSEVCEDE